jgi:zinc protease
MYLSDIQNVSKEVVRPDAVNWFMVGDRAKIADTLDELGFDNIIEIDADGNPIVPALIEKEKRDIKN